MEKIEISRSRIKLFFLLLAALGFVVLGIWMILASGTNWFEKIMGGISVLFFGASVPFGVKQSLSNDIGLEFSKAHLIKEPKSNKKMVLPWDEIEGFAEVNIKGSKIIIIMINHPQDWIDQETSLIKRKIMQLNYNACGTPFSVSASGLRIRHKELLALLREFKSSE